MVPVPMMTAHMLCRPSGSGKTTLLNTLACRLDRNTKVGHGLMGDLIQSGVNSRGH